MIHPPGGAAGSPAGAQRGQLAAGPGGLGALAGGDPLQATHFDSGAGVGRNAARPGDLGAPEMRSIVQEGTWRTNGRVPGYAGHTPRHPVEAAVARAMAAPAAPTAALPASHDKSAALFAHNHRGAAGNFAGSTKLVPESHMGLGGGV